MLNFQNRIYNTSQFMVISLFLSFLLCFCRCFTTELPVCATSLPVSLSPILAILLSHHHMGLTAQVNENLKQRRAPHMMLENSFYYSCTQRKEGETLQPVVIGMSQRSLKQVEGIVYLLLNSSAFRKHTTVFLTSAYH